MRIHVLGTCAGGGLPQWNCGCEYCVRARQKGSGLPPRSQPAIAVSADGKRWSVLNGSPDLRTQFASFPGLHPSPGTRDLPLDSILVTSAELDHTLGLLILREALSFRLFSTRWVRRSILDHNAAWRLLAGTWEDVELEENFFLDNDQQLQARVFEVPGKVPGYLSKVAEMSKEAVVGVRITEVKTGKRLVFVPGARSLTHRMQEEFHSAHCIFIDGTFFTNDELQKIRPGTRDSLAMGHVPIQGPDGSLESLSKLSARCFYIHMNNTNPVLDPESEAARVVEDAGLEVATDGLDLEI